ncbi:MAG: hypothetical protein RSD41_05115 [Kiritimatiellia bacterium]
MTQAFWERFVKSVKTRGTRVAPLHIETGGVTHILERYEAEGDTFLIQRKLLTARMDHRRPIMLIRKSDLRTARSGMLFIACTGTFSSILVPLLAQHLGNLSNVPQAKRSEMLRQQIVLGNLSHKSIDLLQRDTSLQLMIEADQWLQKQGFGLDEVIFLERSPELLDYTRKQGQEWRIRPRVYTLSEMRIAIDHAWQCVSTRTHYCVSFKGVHYITYPEFQQLIAFAATNTDALRDCLYEWVALPPGQTLSRMRRIKYETYHVIEFFGVTRAVAEKLLIPPLERLLEGITLKRTDARDVSDTLAGIGLLFLHALTNPAYALAKSDATVRDLYRLITDDFSSDQEQIDFDDRRIALPGVTIEEGRCIFHPGADERTQTVVNHLLRRLSLQESVEYINVYDVRSSKTLSIGGQSREIVIKTNRHPIAASYIEKRLGSVRVGYANYLLTRANVFRALGASYPVFQLLTEHDAPQTLEHRRTETPYFLRTRCPGDPISTIPLEFFRSDPENPNSAEDGDVVLGIARLYGAAAAQNLMVKKYLPAERTCRFGRGKEIFESTYDPFKHRPMPSSVHVCSIRGSMGWPTLAQTQDNLDESYNFYMHAYAVVLGNYWKTHAEACTLNEAASAFFDGIEKKTEAMHWTYQKNRRSFDSFDPGLRPVFAFRAKLDFSLWALEATAHDLPKLRERFMDYVRDVFVKI